MDERRVAGRERHWRRAVRAAALLALVIGSGCTSGASTPGPEKDGADGAARPVDASLPTVTVYKDPHCTCCRKWADRMRDAGFAVQTVDIPRSSDRDDLKRAHGVTSALASCHTALVGGYVVEGHVPPELVKQMLAEHPAIAGLAVPGMVTGSPGMEGLSSSHYDVLAYTQDGATRVYGSR